MASRTGRRSFLKTAATAGALPAIGRNATAAARGGTDVYARLGVRPVINGIGTVTILGGSIMPPEVVKAMEEASRSFVRLEELQEKVGARIAEFLQAPAAMVTAGAASAITVGAAACRAGGDPQKVALLPDAPDLKDEVIQQRSHHTGYEAQILLTGAKIVWVETREELEKAVNDRTAMMFFLNKADPDGKIKRAEWIEVARKRGVPTFNDAAADIPPASRLSAYVQEGFDLVTFSGGKGLLGPQCSGILLGRKDLIEAGRRAISPHGGIGRGMKVGKEEMIGLLAALERYLKLDHAAERKELEARAAYVIDMLGKYKDLKVSQYVPEIANNVPHVRIEWDASRAIRAKEVSGRLMDGDPPIAVSQHSERGLTISMWMLRPGEHRIVARRLTEVFA